MQVTNLDPTAVPANLVGAVAGVLKAKSQLLEVNEEGTRVKRKTVRVRCA